MGECCVVDAASSPRFSGGVDFVDFVDRVEEDDDEEEEEEEDVLCPVAAIGPTNPPTFLMPVAGYSLGRTCLPERRKTQDERQLATSQATSWFDKVSDKASANVLRFRPRRGQPQESIESR